jgi:hypothetical protein
MCEFGGDGTDGISNESPLTAVENHLHAWGQSIDACFDRRERLLIRDRCRLQRHHHKPVL